MKKTFLLVVAVLATFVSQAQVSLHVNQSIPIQESTSTATKVMFEGTFMTEKLLGYALISGDFYEGGNFTFMQIFGEYKLSSKIPLSSHVEFRSYDFDVNHVYLGLAYTFNTPSGYIAVEPLYRNDSLNLYGGKGWNWKDSRFQLSVVTGHDWKWMNLTSFSDFWTKNSLGGSAGLYSEAWIYFPVYKRLQAGAIVSLSVDSEATVFNLFPGLKIVF